MKTKKEKEFLFNIDVKWVQSVYAKNLKEAIEQVKYSFNDEYGIELKDKEIKLRK